MQSSGYYFNQFVLIIYYSKNKESRFELVMTIKFKRNNYFSFLIQNQSGKDHINYLFTQLTVIQKHYGYLII